MNLKKLFIAFIAAYVFIFAYEFLLHAKLLHHAYEETAHLWRNEADFQSHFPLLMLGQAVMAFFFTLIFARYSPGSGVAGGVRLGILIALFCIGANLITFAVQPLTTTILCGWIVGELIEFAVAGAIIGAIYKPGAAAAV